MGKNNHLIHHALLMLSKIKRYFKSFITENSRIFIILIYNSILVIGVTVFYPLIPVVLNYPPDFIQASKDLSITYGIKQLATVVTVMTLGSICLFIALQGLSNWRDAVNSRDAEQIKSIRLKCLKLPYKIYIFQILFVTICLGIILFTFTLINLNTIYIRILILVSALISISSLASFLITNQIFKQVLLDTYDNQESEGLRVGIRSKTFLLLVPVFVTAILLVSMVGYSRLVEEKGDLYYELYRSNLAFALNTAPQISQTEQIQGILKNIKLLGSGDCTFIITPDAKVITSDGSDLSMVFLYYVKKLKPLYDGRAYDMTCEVQGVVSKVTLGDKSYIVGIKFEVASQKTVIFFIITFIVMLFINILVLFFFSKSLVGDISLVAQSLTEIAEGEKVDLDKKISITSNDEIGDLIVAFNKIQQLEKANLKSIQEKQSIILEKERLASLGEMIGGIAHNLNTPIMSIAGSVEMLKDLIGEYRESIGDKDVTEEDHKEIAAEMMNWLEKIVPHCSYMAEVIKTVKGQAVKLNESSTQKFSMGELLKDLVVLIKNKEKYHGCKIDFDFQVNENIEMQGEINSLIQVLNNLIVNAIHAYGDDVAIVDIKIYEVGEIVEFTIKDYGKGISKDIQSKIFKRMVTTKGKKGTGVGLYMSYSTIKGRFAGNMWFESQEEKGTTFFITIPFTRQ